MMAGAAPDMDGPDFDGIAPQGVLAGPGTITVIAGLTFAISDERGDIGPGPFGLITDDTRHLSRLQVRLDSEPLRHLGSGLISPAVARFRCYATLSNRLPDAPVECERLRELSPAGMVETLTLRCWTPDPVQVRLSIQLDSDFADIFQLRRLAGDPSAQSSGIPVHHSPGQLRFEAAGTPRATSVQLDPPPDVVERSEAHWTVPLSRDQPWILRIEVSALRGAGSAERLAVQPRTETTGRPDVVVHSLPERLARGCLRSLTDLDALSIPDMAHLLWCGVPSQQEADQVAAHLGSPAMASGWGLRTLSAEMAGYNPISYHVGSVWPHDTVIACEGLRRYGLDDVAMRLVGDLLDALAIFDDRLPELFGGHHREPSDFPVPYPTACWPQAWAAGVPLAIVALCLGLQPDVPAGTVSLNPVLPRGVAPHRGPRNPVPRRPAIPRA